LMTVGCKGEVGERGLVQWMDWGYNLQGGKDTSRPVNSVLQEKATVLA
jgi:hypothetical protein